MPPARRWMVTPRLSDEDLRRFPDLPPLIVQLLANRELTAPSQVEPFLAGADAPLEDPLRLTSVDRAVERIFQAIDGGELIAIYGDYDADGLTATALLDEVLSALGARVLPYIPRRESGYGLTAAGLEAVVARRARLVITADCGISSRREVDAVRQRGVEVIVTDHHQVTGSLPDAIVVNPRQPGCEYPFKDLAAVGVAYKLARHYWPLGSPWTAADRRTWSARSSTWWRWAPSPTW